MDDPTTTKHTVHWMLEPDGYIPGPRFACSGTIGDRCRLHCPEGCESYTYEGHEHELADAGECMFLPWMTMLDRFDLEETYAGVRHEAASGPIVFKYEDEYVVWWYADDEKTNEAHRPKPAPDHWSPIGPEPMPAIFKEPWHGGQSPTLNHENGRQP